MISFSDLPTVNAALNGTSTLLLITGYLFIRRKKIKAHKTCMLSAATVSALFLTSYVIYHSQVGYTRFTGEGFIRSLYFVILIPHTILAVVAVVPLVLITVYLAWRENFRKHKRIARWTLPIWLYVSVTGVLIYWMLYHLT